jgi:cardiolipin-specific phospholipase
MTEHRVLSFIPHVQKPPTATGSAPTSRCGSRVDVNKDNETERDSGMISSFNDPHGERRWHVNYVKLPGKDRALNEFSVERVGEEVEHNLVMLHGYGAGLGFFYKNFEALSRKPGWKVYALDLLGMGRSSRPNFKIHAKDREGKITEAENWFIDALEEWRKAKKIDRFTLLGHSLGGYMAVAYALKYPGHLNKLILASPVGIPEDPYAMAAEMPEPEDSTMANEFTQDQQAAVPDQNNLGNRAPKDQNAQRRPLPKWLTYLWDANVSPFSLVRWSGPLGPRLVSGWTSRRFSHLPSEEAQALHDYSYSLFRQRGSGEFALAYILAPGAFARSPLIRRIQGVGRQYLRPHDGPIPDTDANGNGNAVDRPRETGLPVVLMYGEHDWMDVAGGFAAEQKMKDEKERILKGKSREVVERDQGDAKVVIIRKAGHHVYLDG